VNCPLCGSLDSRPASHTGSPLRICASCGVVFNTAHHPLAYDKRYFVDDYQAQYGKTYAEDAPAIRALAARRLEIIFRCMESKRSRSSLRLLDIGSALGFFLKEAMDRGIGHAEGVEISPFAAAYCRETFNIPVQEIPFEKAALDGPFDIITAWYFLEHCADPARAFEKMTSLLSPGGMVALATPSVFGPLFVFDRAEWSASHPADHRVDFSPSTIRVFLRNRGFTRIKIIPSGIHPERILSSHSVIFKPFAGIYTLLSNLSAFSDTLEAYALKMAN
jgi:SAM-dependent methyltransferase